MVDTSQAEPNVSRELGTPVPSVSEDPAELDDWIGESGIRWVSAPLSHDHATESTHGRPGY